MAYNPDKIKKIVMLGVQGENLASKIEFNMADWSALYPEGVYSIILKRPEDEIPYPVLTEYNSETKILTWFVTSIDTAQEGQGQAELLCNEGEIIDKSFIFDVQIEPCLDPSGDVPDPLENWYERMIQVEIRTKEYRDEASGFASEAKDAKEDAVDAKDAAVIAKGEAEAAAREAEQSASEIEDLTVSSHSLPVNSDPTVDKTGGDGEPYNLDFGLPKGNILFASFSIDPLTGELSVNYPEGFAGMQFNINSEGYLEVTIDA